MAYPVAKFLVPVTAYTASDAVNRRVVISSPIWGANSFPSIDLRARWLTASSCASA